MRGKEKCKILKQIRAEIAKQNDIEWITSECQHKGECKGTCPKCEAEVRKLEHELELKRKMGKNVAVAGIATGIALSATGCAVPNPVEGIKDFFTRNRVVEIQGDMEYIPDTELILDGEMEYVPDTQNDGNDDLECGTECDTEEAILLDGDVVYIPEDEEDDFTEERDNDSAENEQDNLSGDGSVHEGDE